MRRVTACFMITAALFLCSWTGAEPVALTDNNVKEGAGPIIEAVQESYNTGNYGKMARYFSEEMFRYFSQVDFEAMRSNIMPLYGKLENMEYLAFITQLGDTHVL